MTEREDPSRFLKLADVAKILRVSYERARVFAAKGRIPTIKVPRIGRAVRWADLERFQETPRPTGRPRTRPQKPHRVRRGPGSIHDLLALVERKTGSRLTLSAYRSLIKVGLLRRRRSFPRGEEGKRFCLACQYRLLVPIVRLQGNSVKSYRDLAIALKWRHYRPSHDMLSRAMLSYLYAYRRARELLKDDDLEQFVMNESSMERSPRLPHRMNRQQREAAYRGLAKIGFGKTFTTRDMTAVRDGVGLPKEGLPDRDTSGEAPGLSWSDIFQGIQVIDKEIDLLVDQAIMGTQQRGKRQVILYRPFATPQELDKAWEIARSLLESLRPQLIERLRGVSPRAHVLYVNATIVKTVIFCLIQLREQGDAAFSPFRGEFASLNPVWQEACVRLMVTPPPEPMASLVRQVMTNPPKTDQERRKIVAKFELALRSASLSEKDRRVMDETLTVLRRPSKKGFKKILAMWEAWRAGANKAG